MAEDIRNRQDHIRFLEDFIVELTKKIDELTEQRDLEKEIHSLEYRLEVLSKANGRFDWRVKDLKSQLTSLKEHFEKIKPMLDKLIDERAYYRDKQTEL
ncbi:MAG: hypothetical protein ABIC40_04365 [bacterium]